MGACFDELTLDGSLTESQVKKQFEKHQDECSHESGNSYSGRLNMCNGIEFPSVEFDTEEKGWDYLQKKCQKWENAIAVRCKESNPVKPDAKLLKLQTTRKSLEEKKHSIEREMANEMENHLKSVEFIKCPTCKSKLDTRFRTRTLKCPVCEGSFLTKSKLNKVSVLKVKILDLTAKIDKHCDELQDKANKKPRKTRWLIGGWCSS